MSIGVNISQLLTDVVAKMTSPKQFISPYLNYINLTSFEKRFARNCDRFHAAMLKIIGDRRAGKVEGWSPDSSDILSVMMKSDLYEND